MRQHGKFINNKVLVLLSKNKFLIDKINTSGSFWNDGPEIQVKLLLQIQVKIYQKYLSDSESSFLADRKFVIDFLKNLSHQMKISSFGRKELIGTTIFL